jgi:peroxiredoxin Q/BCP
MAQLRQHYEDLTKHDTEVLVVGPEDKEAFADYFRQHKLPYKGLPDPGHSVLKRYGQEVNLFKLGRMPAQVLIDKKGIVLFAHYGKQMNDIPQPPEIIEALQDYAALQAV